MGKIFKIIILGLLLTMPAKLMDAETRIVDKASARELYAKLFNEENKPSYEAFINCLEGFQKLMAENLVDNSRIVTLIDYTKPSNISRLWVIDMESGRVLYQEWVAHGMGKPRGSGGDMEEALSFSNERGTLKSCLGLFITAETYYGRHGYSLKLDGLEEGVNDNARERLIVLHSAHYVSEDRADDRLIGRSWGCPAVRPGIVEILIDAIKEGSVLWVYYPHEEWLEESEFLDDE